MFVINTIRLTLYLLMLDTPVKGTEFSPRAFSFVPYLLQGFLFYDLFRFSPVFRGTPSPYFRGVKKYSHTKHNAVRPSDQRRKLSNFLFSSVVRYTSKGWYISGCVYRVSIRCLLCKLSTHRG